MGSEVFLHESFDVEWQSMLQETTYLSSVLAMTVANREKVTMFQTHNVGRCYVGILVCFIRVVSGDATLGSEWELGYNVANFITFLGRLLGRRWFLSLGVFVSTIFSATLLLLVRQLLLLSELLGSGLHSLKSLALSETMDPKTL